MILHQDQFLKREIQYFSRMLSLEGKETLGMLFFHEESIIDNDQVFIPIVIQDTIIEQDNNENPPQIQPIEQTQQPQEVSLRRSTRERRSVISGEYLMYLQEHEDDISLTEDDSSNFCQAMKSSNSQKWICVMEEEIKSMRDNDVCDIVELPESVKPIGCKWIFKTKRDSVGNIERYKAHLVAKGFT